MLDGFRLARFLEDDNAIDCFGPLYIAQLALRIILVFSETLFMTKNHRVSKCYTKAKLSIFRHKLMMFSAKSLITENKKYFL